MLLRLLLSSFWLAAAVHGYGGQEANRVGVRGLGAPEARSATQSPSRVRATGSMDRATLLKRSPGAIAAAAALGLALGAPLRAHAREPDCLKRGVLGKCEAFGIEPASEGDKEERAPGLRSRIVEGLEVSARCPSYYVSTRHDQDPLRSTTAKTRDEAYFESADVRCSLALLLGRSARTPL